MAQTVSVEFLAACAAAGQSVVRSFEVSWDKSGLISATRGGAGWTDETSNLAGARGELRISPPGEKLVAAGQIGTMTVTLHNPNGRYSWKRSDGALYANIGGASGMVGIPVRLWQGYVTANGPEYVCIFTGVIVDWSEPFGAVSLSCKDWGWRYLQNKRSTAVAVDQRVDEWIDTIATGAGIISADMSLDVGIYTIRFAWMDDESTVEEIWDAAACDGGLAFFDQRGILHYQNSLHWVSQSSVWTFAERSHKLSDPEVRADDLATKVTVEYSGRYIGGMTNLYEIEQYKVIPPGGSEQWVARFRYATYAVVDPDPDEPYEDYYATSLGGTNMTDQLTVALTNKYGQQCTVTVTNGSDKTSARLVKFRIRGMGLIGGPTEQAEATTSAPLAFERVRQERGNPYCQTMEQAQALADMLALRTGRVRPIWRLSDVPGLPHLEPMDLITFTDNRKLGSGQSVQGLVVGIAFESSAKGFKQQIAAMDVTDLSEYDDYFIVGTDALGANKRVYY